MITSETLKYLFTYDPETGQFVRKVRRKLRAGTVAGCMTNNGYLVIHIDGKLYLTHRLAFLYMTGEWPTKNVDHIDMDKTNNRWSNLRLADKSENGCNRSKQINNTSGMKGVSWARRSEKWQVFITSRGKQKSCGLFDSFEAACTARIKIASAEHGEFMRV